jgi:hypothetical protein
LGRSSTCDLVLVAKRRQGHLDDFGEISSLIRQRTPDVIPFVMNDHSYNSVRSLFSWRPTLVVSPLELKRFRPWRSRLCENRFLLKSEEYRRLAAVNVPIPQWTLLTSTHTPDLTAFGPYVVQKPDCGGRGAEVRIKRKARVRWSPPRNKRSVVNGMQDLVIQDFVYTGQWPSSYRVTTWFGVPLFAWKVTASKNRRALVERYGFRGGEDGGGMSICSSGEGCTFELCYESDVLELATLAHSAFPDFPILGIDIVRDAESGRLHVLEANTCGHLWHFSSPTGISIQRDNGIDFKAQFNGLERAAEVLINETLKRAA